MDLLKKIPRITLRLPPYLIHRGKRVLRSRPASPIKRSMKVDYGPLQGLLADQSITEIMINAPDEIFVEHQGKLIPTSLRFVDARALEELVTAILIQDGKDPVRGPCFDGSLENGSRYNITLPPMTRRYPCLTIRKFAARGFFLSELVARQSLTDQAARFLAIAVKARQNILVSGGTGAGKTSLLQALAREIPENERLISIEDVAELKLSHRNQVPLFSSREVSTRDCLVNALRMRPDRILVGECRRDETFYMLQAMNTGHEGSMTSLHANSPGEALVRLENLLYMSKLELPLKALRTQIAQSVNFIVQIRRFPSGQRRVTEVMELTGMEGDVITKASVFALDERQELQSTGYVPRAAKNFALRGHPLPEGFFNVPASATRGLKLA